MNYRDFYKNKQATVKDVKSLIPEGVSQLEFKRAMLIENRMVNDIVIAAKIASRNLKEDANYYKKLHEHESFNDDEEIAFDAAEEPGNEYDDNGGLPKIGGALAVPHVGQPIMMGKIIQVGGEFKGGQSASGEQSGMTNCAGVNKDTGGIKVQPINDKEPITAGGKAVDSSIASKSVGGSVVPGEGQKQGGPNSQGTIAATAKLNESKNKIRSIVKEVLKEIKYDKASGKWVKINESAGICDCGAQDKSEHSPHKDSCGVYKTDETVNMKMGVSYKTVQPRQYKVMDDDTARTNQYEPEITEMYDDEEETVMNERYVELANEQRNLSEAELTELKALREKIDNMQAVRRNFGLSQGGTEPSLYEDDKWIQKAVNPAHKGYCTPESKPTCTPARKALAQRFKKGLEEDEVEHPDDARERQEFQRGIDRNNRRNPQRYECPTCKTPNALSHDQHQKGYQCDGCADAEEGPMENVDMKMGPSYKTVQPTLAKTSNDDFARQNQYDPEVSEAASEIDVTMDAEGVNEAGGGATQHSSYRTLGKKDHGNHPQDPKTRWANDLDEGQSKVSKAIAKGQKGKTSTFKQSLKHQKPSKTSSGVHKRKP